MLLLCENCGERYPDYVVFCPQCERENVMDQPNEAAASNSPVIERPNGSFMIMFGWAALVLGCILIVVGYSVDTGSGTGYPDLERIGFVTLAMGGGGGLVDSGFFLILTGYIVRAISFLPGRDDK